jgi:putative transposase
MGDMEIPDELIDQLLGEYRGPEQLTGPDGLINQLRRRLIERAAGAELEQHLGYPQGADAPEGVSGRPAPTSSQLVLSSCSGDHSSRDRARSIGDSAWRVIRASEHQCLLRQY